MAKPQKVEDTALEHAGTLLQFAAENKQLPENVVLTIAASWDAAAQNNWTPETSAKFWTAYNTLCTAIRPASLDSIRVTNEPSAASLRWMFWRGDGSKPKVAARSYLATLIVFLLVSIFLQFAVSNAASLATETDKMIAEMDQTIVKMTQAIAALRGAIGTRAFSEAKLTADQTKTISDVQNEFRQIWLMEDRIAAKLELFSLLTWIGRYSWEYGNLKLVDSVAEFDAEVQKYYYSVRSFRKTEETGSLVTKVVSSTVLPLFLGIVGACAYITRLISEQIRDSTFSSTSPVRHLVRFALGALAGVVVGLGWIGSGGSTSLPALAFIAGYAVEPVFATVDGIAEKFRRT